MRGRIAAMARAWARRKVACRCLVFVLAIRLGAGVSAAAQEAPKSRPAPGAWLIILPPRVIAGANATLAVLDYQGRLLPNIVVELSTGQKVTTDATGRAIFRAPDGPGKLRAVSSGGNVGVSAEVLPVDEAAMTAAADRAPPVIGVVSYPRVLATRDRFTLEGAGFRGEADLNRVSLNGDPCLILAASPAALVVLPGERAPVGEATLHVTVAGADAGQFPVAVVLLEFSGAAEGASASSAGQLVLHARGSKQPLVVEVRNASPAVIELTKGNVQRLKTSGGEENAVPVDVKFVTAGNYIVSARLVAPSVTSPDLQSARKRLAEAKKIAPGDWSARIDRVLSTMDRTPRDLPQIRAEVRAMLDDRPAPPLASLLDSAWRELN
jgi:hypothetical protein